MPLSFLNRLGLAGLLALAAAGPAVAEWRDIPYANIAKMPLTLKKVDPQKIFTATLHAKPGDGQTTIPADFKLQMKVGQKIVPVTIHPDGLVDLPVRQDWVDAGAMIQSNQPKGRVKVDFRIDSRTPPGTRMTYAQLTESADRDADPARRQEEALEVGRQGSRPLALGTEMADRHRRVERAVAGPRPGHEVGAVGGA